MRSVRLHLLDEDETLIDSVDVESDDEYALSNWFTSPDGGLYVVCEIDPASTPMAVTGIWIDGPHPATRIG
jgi:hypothetical protein